jgi:hypothetical protein
MKDDRLRRGEGTAMPDQSDVPAEDLDTLWEVELTTTLIVAARESEEDLCQDEIDRLLGVTARRLPG